MAGNILKIAFALSSVLGLLFLIISVASNSWSKVEGLIHEGLFRSCSVKRDVCVKIKLDLLTGERGSKYYIHGRRNRGGGAVGARAPQDFAINKYAPFLLEMSLFRKEKMPWKRPATQV